MAAERDELVRRHGKGVSNHVRSSAPTDGCEIVRGSVFAYYTYLLLLSFAVSFPSLPGRMNSDSLDLYGQSLSGKYHDWHAPLVAWLWNQIDLGPMGLSFQTVAISFMVVVSCATIIRSLGVGRAISVIGATAFTLSPPVLGFLVAVSKDTWAGALILAAMALLRLPRAGLTVWLATRALCYALAAYLRPELIVFIPIFLIFETFGSGGQGQWLTGAKMLVLVASFSALLGITERTMVKPQRTYPVQQLFILDLASLSIRSDEMLLPSAAFPAQSLEVLRKHYSLVSVVPIIWGQPQGEMTKLGSEDDVKALRSSWIRGIAAMPGTYLHARWGLFNAYLDGRTAFIPGIDRNPSIELFNYWYNEKATSYLRAAPKWLYTHYIPLIGSALLAVGLLLYGSPKHRTLAYFLMFAVLYQLSFFFIASGPDFRYGYAGVLVFYCSAISLLCAVLSAATQKYLLGPAHRAAK